MIEIPGALTGARSRLNKEISQFSSEAGKWQRASGTADMPLGVAVRDLAPHEDERGTVTEIHRDEWRSGEHPVQWNAVRSGANVLRGVHVHRIHADEIVVVDGVMLLGLHDVRRDSPTRGLGFIFELRGDAPRAVTIPPGVAHGFFFPEPTLLVYAVSSYFSAEDEIGCRFDSPELGLSWPTATPILSKRDAGAGTYREMMRVFLSDDNRRKAVSSNQ